MLRCLSFFFLALLLFAADVSANQRALNIFGIEIGQARVKVLETIKGQKFEDTIHKDDREFICLSADSIFGDLVVVLDYGRVVKVSSEKLRVGGIELEAGITESECIERLGKPTEIRLAQLAPHMADLKYLIYKQRSCLVRLTLDEGTGLERKVWRLRTVALEKFGFSNSGPE